MYIQPKNHLGTNLPGITIYYRIQDITQSEVELVYTQELFGYIEVQEHFTLAYKSLR